MSSTAKIDQNDKPTWLAYNETTGLTEPIVVDPISNVLYVFNVGNTAPVPTASINLAKIDGDDNPTQTAYNSTSELIEALRCDSSGNLITILI